MHLLELDLGEFAQVDIGRVCRKRRGIATAKQRLAHCPPPDAALRCDANRGRTSRPNSRMLSSTSFCGRISRDCIRNMS